jgi:hypothetical protein
MESAYAGTMTVAKKKEARGIGKMVRIDPRVVTQARVVAQARGVALSDYLSDVCRSVVARDYLSEIKRLEREGGR